MKYFFLLIIESYLENDDAIMVESDKDLVHLSMLFKWYHSDFGSNKGEILQWIHDQFPESAEKLKQLDGLFEKIGKDNVKIKNVTYDWGHNEKD